MWKNQLGMTLLEILIVLGILGGLMVTIFGQINKQVNKSKVRQTQMQFGQIKSALEQYSADCGDYPPTDVGLNALLSGEGTNCQNWGPEPYLDKKAIKDSWNMDIIYENTGSNFILKSLGSDKKEGGDGFARDITSGDQSDEK
jgi:general secretion pathway protein G